MTEFAQQFYDYHRIFIWADWRAFYEDTKGDKMLGDLKPIKEGAKMIEDMTDWEEVKDGECFTTGLIDGSKIACSEINHIYMIYTDNNGKEWIIKDMLDGEPPIMVAREEE